ncbi:MAG TPA: glycosyltransferase family 9 protein [Vicinamibacterales bacterium]
MRILLVRLRLLGDVVFTTPIIRGVRRRFPDAYIAYLVEEPAAPVVRANPHLDEVIIARRPSGAARVLEDLRLGLTLRRRRFDLVLDLHGGPRASWITWLTGARERIGYTIAGRSWMYTRVVDRPRELRARHSVENQWDLLAALGEGPPDPVRDPLEMAEDPAAAARVDRRLQTLGVERGTPLVVLHVSAGNPFRRWPAAHFAELAAGIVTADPARAVVLTAGPSDRGAAESIGEQARRLLPERLRERILRAGEFDLPELRALIGRAALFIGGDSGPLHVAGTTETPIVGLFGPTLAARSAPWRDPAIPARAVEPPVALACRPCDQRVCVPGDFRCLAAIAPGQVLAAVESVLAPAAARTARSE